MSTPPYQEGVNYLRSSVIRDSYSFGGDGTNINVVTKCLGDVQYIATFSPVGEAPYGGKIVQCVYVKALT